MTEMLVEQISSDLKKVLGFTENSKSFLWEIRQDSERLQVLGKVLGEV